jgi:nucleoside-diphosphate-sugar epimerase
MAALHVAIREAALGRSAVFPATFGRPDDTWQPMYSKDVAATFIAATFVEETQHAIFNPPVRQLLTIQESLEILQSLVPDVTVTFGTDTSANVTGDLPLLDSSRVEKELGVTQEYDLSTGLAEMIDHYRSTTSESG